VRGGYILIARLDRPVTVRVGALGSVRFGPAAYAYVGSAMSGLEPRIERHLRPNKRLHWHIDYLLQHAEVVDVVRVESEERVECRIARALAARLDAVPGFGCSDCRCASHLFVHEDTDSLRQAIGAALRGLE